MAEINNEPIRIKIFSDLHGEKVFLNKFIEFVTMHRPDIVALEMLPIGPYNEETAHTVTQYFGDEYLEAAKYFHSMGIRVVGLEEKRHRPFHSTAAGIWKNMVIRTQGYIEQDWLNYLEQYRGMTVAILCGRFHADKLRILMKLKT